MAIYTVTIPAGVKIGDKVEFIHDEKSWLEEI